MNSSQHPFEIFQPQELGPSSYLAAWPQTLKEKIFQIERNCRTFDELQVIIGVLSKYDRYLLWVNLGENLQKKCNALYKVWSLSPQKLEAIML